MPQAIPPRSSRSQQDTRRGSGEQWPRACLNREVNCWARSSRSSPNLTSLERLVGAVLDKYHDEWKVIGRRCLSECFAVELFDANSDFVTSGRLTGLPGGASALVQKLRPVMRAVWACWARLHSPPALQRAS